MLQNAYFLAKVGADTAENEQHFAEIFPRPPGRGRRAQAVLALVTALARACGASPDAAAVGSAAAWEVFTTQDHPVVAFLGVCGTNFQNLNRNIAIIHRTSRKFC